MKVSRNVRLMTIIAMLTTLVTIPTNTIYINAYKFTYSTPDFAQTFSITTNNINLAKGIGEQFAKVYSVSSALKPLPGENSTIGITQTDYNTLIQKDISESINKLVKISDLLKANQNSNTAGNTVDASGITITDDNAAGIFVSIDIE